MKKTKLEWIEFDLLKACPQLVHGTFLKHGGVSKEPFATLNVSISSGDSLKSVRANRETICKALDLPKTVYAKVNHGINIEQVTHLNAEILPECDALFTTEKNLGLTVAHADCQAAIFYDPIHQGIGIVHAGWRGLVQNIYEKMYLAMHQALSTCARDLIVCISPSIGPDHAEYKNYKEDFPKDFWSFQKAPNYFDFWGIARKQLTSCGILEENIEVSDICTHCNKEDCFSYRRDKKTGRHATVVALKSQV